MYDRKPDLPRSPIVIAGDLALRHDRLSNEAAKCIRDLAERLAAAEEEVARLRGLYSVKSL